MLKGWFSFDNDEEDLTGDEFSYVFSICEFRVRQGQRPATPRTCAPVPCESQDS